MSNTTEKAMLDAIGEHFRDEGLAIDDMHGVLVRLLVTSGCGDASPARYMRAPEYITSAALTNSASFDEAWVAKGYVGETR